MELESSVVSSLSLKGDYCNNKLCCGKSCRIKWLSNKGVILVLLWSVLGFSVYHYFTISKISRDPTGRTLNPSEKITIVALLPIGGWLADAYLGRYRVIRYGMWTMWFGTMLNGLSLVIGKVIEIYGTSADPWVSLFSKVIMGVGLGAYLANLVQFGLDQLIDASSSKITLFIFWYTMSTFISGIFVHYSSFCAPEYVGLLVLAVFLTLALVSDFLFSHYLLKEQVISNPLPLILKVLCYTIKANCCKKANNIKHGGVLSNFNIAKRVFNGPFDSEQVEDVKTFFRVIIVVIVFTIASSGIPTVLNVTDQIAQHFPTWPSNNETDVKGCYQGLNIFYATYVFGALAALVYLILIYPVVLKCIPRISITTKFLFSVLLFFAAVLVLLGIESAAYLQQLGRNQTSFTCTLLYNLQVEINVYLIILPNILNGLSMFVFFCSGLEFVCAQAPLNMKGTVLGIACVVYGFGTLIHAAISQPFIDFSKRSVWQKAPLTCGIWYFMMEGAIVLIGFIVMAVIVKTYKRRMRFTSTISHSIWHDYDTID